MPGTGPAPSPTSRRQSGSLASTWTALPLTGYSGAIPKWPGGKPSKPEAETWARVWRTPQAAAWVKLGWTDDVAVYVRALVAGRSSMDARMLAEARQWSDRLGLNPTSMLKNRWRVVEDEVAPRRQSASRTSRRLKVVDDAVEGTG